MDAGLRWPFAPLRSVKAGRASAAKSPIRYKFNSRSVLCRKFVYTFKARSFTRNYVTPETEEDITIHDEAGTLDEPESITEMKKNCKNKMAHSGNLLGHLDTGSITKSHRLPLLLRSKLPTGPFYEDDVKRTSLQNPLQ